MTPSSIEVVFPADYKVYDGRYANNAWLQELPDPITKLTWDNAVLLSKSTAKALQVDDGDMLEISVGRSKIAGARDDCPRARRLFAQSFARIRTMGGWQDWTGTGFNAYELRTTSAPYYATRATVKLVQKKGHQLVQTQDHYSMEGRALVRGRHGRGLQKESGFRQSGLDGCRDPTQHLALQSSAFERAESMGHVG